MLEIKPIQNKEEQMEICRKCNLDYKEDFFAYKAFEGDILIAGAQFDINGKTAVIDGINKVAGTSDDYEALFILGRAVLNFLDLCGVEDVFFNTRDEYSEKLSKMIGFKMDQDGKMKIHLVGLFTTPCHGDHSK